MTRYDSAALVRNRDDHEIGLSGGAIFGLESRCATRKPSITAVLSGT